MEERYYVYIVQTLYAAWERKGFLIKLKEPVDDSQDQRPVFLIMATIEELQSDVSKARSAIQREMNYLQDKYPQHLFTVEQYSYEHFAVFKSQRFSIKIEQIISDKNETISS